MQINDDFEVNISKCPNNRYLKEFCSIFPDFPKNYILFIVSVMQRSSCDLVVKSVESEKAKNFLCDRFISWGKSVSSGCLKKGFWCDLEDPATGYPLIGKRGGVTHNDVESFQSLLKYNSEQVGSCWVLEHPKWRTSCYPSSLFIGVDPTCGMDAEKILQKIAKVLKKAKLGE